MDKYYKLCWRNPDDTQEYRSYLASSVMCRNQLDLIQHLPIYQLNQWTKAPFGGLAVFDSLQNVFNFDSNSLTYQKNNVFIFECEAKQAISQESWPRNTYVMYSYQIWMKQKRQHKKLFVPEPNIAWPKGTKLFRKVKLTKLLGSLLDINKLVSN